MTDNYTGWKLFDKVIIVAKRMTKYNNELSKMEYTDNYQGYVVDPKNKKQLETALNWGNSTIHSYGYVDGKYTVIPEDTYEAKQYEYENDGFKLELSGAAEGSSQGGKLSFWNCWITAPDGRRFLIGIAADLLLDVLKNSTVVNGQVQGTLMFARCKGGVGMLNRTMDSYKAALNDESLKKKMSKGKTSKHIVGHVYETATEKNVYFGKFYRWYEPIYRWDTTSIWAPNSLIGFRRLTTPVELVFFPTYYEGKKFSDYDPLLFQCREKAPARREADEIVEIDSTMEEFIHKFEQHYIYDSYQMYADRGIHQKPGSVYTDAVGLSATNDPEYALPEQLRKIIIEWGFTIQD